MDEANQLALITIAVAVGVVIGLLLGAVILRAAVSLSNQIAPATSPAGKLEVPSFGKAFAIVFFTNLAICLVSFGAGLVLGTGGGAIGLSRTAVFSLAQVISLPLSFLVMSFMLSNQLKTTMARGMGISLCYLAVVLAMVVVGVVVAMVLAPVLFR
ncbi:MAG TPA: hypothetical protein VFV87_03220 [Pirellulaceae bacterium]|nr:hypothetical protein [Pirellulaceae bacterium]